MTQRRGGRSLAWAVALAAAGLLVSCDNAAPDPGELFNQFALVEASSDGRMAPTALEAEAIALIRGAKRSVYAAFEDLESEAVADALIEAQARGLVVRVVSDEDSAGQRGLVRLAEGLQPEADGRIPLRLGDGSLTYSPQPTVTLTRTGDMNRMTHNFIIADELRMMNLSGGFPACEAGASCDAGFWQAGFVVKSEDIAKDYTDEFVQMYGGVFSTTLDTFNGPQKSDANARTYYPSDSGAPQVYFGPQERLLKRVLDEIYAARASVLIVTEEFAHNFGAEALIYKVSTGFNVRVVTEPDGSSCEQDAECPNFQVCVQRACEIPFNQIDRLRTGFEESRTGASQRAEVRTLRGIRGTLVVIDGERSPINGERYKTQVFVLSQPFTSAISYAAGQEGTARPSDGFMDSNMWVLTEYPGQENPQVRELAAQVQGALSASEEVEP